MQDQPEVARLNNQRLFDVFAKKLDSDEGAFSEVTEKLAAWLDNSKAYYDEARPEIIRLLTIALSTLRRAVGATNPTDPFHVLRYIAHPLAPPYVKLIRVVEQYKHLFVEHELEAQLHYLIGMVSSSLPPPAKADSHILTSLAGQTTVASSAPCDMALAKSDISTLTVPSESPPAPEMHSNAKAVQGTAQRVKKKRKTLEHLIDVDQRKFRESTLVVNASPTRNKLNEVNEESPNAIQPTGPSEIILPPDSPRSISLEARKLTGATVEDGHLLPDLPEKRQREFMPEEDRQQQDVQDTSILDSGRKRVIPNISLRIQTERAPSCDENLSKLIKPIDVVSPEQVEDDKLAMNLISGTAALNNNVGMTKTEDVNEYSTVGATVADEMVLDCEISMHGQVIEKIRELHVKLSQYASQVPLPYQDMLSNFSEQEEDAFDLRERTSLQISMPTTETVKEQKIDNTSMHIETTAAEEIGQPRVDTPDALKCNTNEISVVHPLLGKIKVSTFVRGLSNPGKMTFNFTIKQGIHSALSCWVKGQGYSNDAICITLGCYKATDDALNALASKNEQKWRGFVSTQQSAWPQNGGLQLVLTTGQRYNLPLSPPLSVTPDGLFDMSRLLVVGTKGFELHFSRNMSKYVFALVLHPPTPGQLKWQYERWKKEQDWKNWIFTLSQPFNIEPVPLPSRQ